MEKPFHLSGKRCILCFFFNPRRVFLNSPQLSSRVRSSASLPECLNLEEIDDYPSQYDEPAGFPGDNSQVPPIIFRFASGSRTPARRLRKSSDPSTTVRLIPRCCSRVSLTCEHSFRRIKPIGRELENQSYACGYVLLILSLTGVYENSVESVADSFLHQFSGYCTIDTAGDGPNL